MITIISEKHRVPSLNSVSYILAGPRLCFRDEKINSARDTTESERSIVFTRDIDDALDITVEKSASKVSGGSFGIRARGECFVTRDTPNIFDY